MDARLKLMISLLLLILLPSLLVLFLRRGPVSNQGTRVGAATAETIDKTGKAIPQPEFSGKATQITLLAAGKDTPTAGSDLSGRTIIPSILGGVSDSVGAAVYIFPLTLPKGSGGLTPNIALSYSSQTIDDSRLGNGRWEDSYSVAPSLTGMGFTLSGLGSIVRDTRGRRDVPVLGGEVYHRFILNLPSGSFELRYNPTDRVWTTSPQGFLRILHSAPNSETTPTGFDLPFVDADEWVITTKDGTSYFFGELSLASELTKSSQGNAQIKGAMVFNERGQLHTKGGSLTTEYVLSERCVGPTSNPCATPQDRTKPALMVTKWLLRKVQTADTRSISFSYETQQKKLGSGEFVTTVSYPLAILWNDDSYRVSFRRETRPDTGPDEDLAERISEVWVEAKNTGDNQYYPARKYLLSYFAAKDLTPAGIPEIPKRAVHHSLLSTITEVGFDDRTKTPPVAFEYGKVGVESANSVYLSKISNGYGGETTFAYKWFSVPYKTSNNQGDATANGRWGSSRARVTEKVVTDTVQNKSYTETYTYGEPRGFAETRGDQSREEQDCPDAGCYPPTGLQFLGHSDIDILTTDFDHSAMNHRKLTFYQANETPSCFEISPARGLVRETLEYQGESVARRTSNQYNYWLTGDDIHDIEVCKSTRVNQPYFVYLIRQDNYLNSSNQSIAAEAAKSSLHTAEEYRQYDKFGNLTKSVQLGEITAGGQDADPGDNRYHFATFTPGDTAWILNLPALSYTSTAPECGSADLFCQHERSEYLYDDKDLTSPPEKGFLTGKRLYRAKDRVYREKYDYDGFGNRVRTYRSRASDATSSEVALVEEKSYDNYYHTLLLGQSNNGGFKTIFDNYDFRLQAPQIIKTQVSTTPDAYATKKILYDGLGRITTVYTNDPRGYGKILEDYPASITHYFADGNRLTTRTLSLTAVENDQPGYKARDTFYDGLGNIIQTQVLATSVDGSRQRLVQSTTVNAQGNVTEAGSVSMENPVQVTVETISGQPPQFVQKSGTPTRQLRYDMLGRLVRQMTMDATNGSTYTTHFAYGANSESTTEPNGLEKLTVYDGWNRALRITTRDQSAQYTLAEQYTYGNTLLNQPTQKDTFSASNPGEKLTETYSYDDAGNLTAWSHPYFGSFAYSYDLVGNRISETKTLADRSVLETQYTFDNAGRMRQKTYSKALYGKRAADKKSFTFTYDEGANAVGKLSRVEDPVGSTAYTYDKGQRLLEVKKQIFDRQKTIQYSSNVLSQTTEAVYDSDRLHFGYDSDNRLQSILLNGKNLATNIFYDKRGKETGMTVDLPRSRLTSRTQYDDLGRIQQSSLQSQAGKIYSLAYTYAPTAEVAQISDLVDSTKSLTYSYDGFSRLSGTTGAYTAKYQYDAFGRMREKTEGESLVFTYGSSSPFFAPESVEGAVDKRLATRLSYDRTGGLTSDGTSCYRYNLQGQLILIETREKPAENCDAANISQRTYLYYDYTDRPVLIEEYTRDKESTDERLTKSTYIFGDLEETLAGEASNGSNQKRLMIPIASYLTALHADNELYLLVKDQVSSLRKIVNASGESVADLLYYPYGTVVGSLPAKLPTDLLYTSQRQLAAAPVYNFGVRFYHPTLGIFIQPDPLMGPNRYAYAGGNPVSNLDPTGMAFTTGEVGGGGQSDYEVSRPSSSTALTQTGVYETTRASSVIPEGEVPSYAVDRLNNPTSRGVLQGLLAGSVVVVGAAMLAPELGIITIVGGTVVAVTTATINFASFIARSPVAYTRTAIETCRLGTGFCGVHLATELGEHLSAGPPSLDANPQISIGRQAVNVGITKLYETSRNVVGSASPNQTAIGPQPDPRQSTGPYTPAVRPPLTPEEQLAIRFLDQAVKNPASVPFRR